MPAPRATPPDKLIYLLYDDRAAFDLDQASVLFSSDDLAEARAEQRLLGGVLFVYKLVNGTATDGRPLRDDE